MALVEVQNVKKFYRKKPNLIKALNGVNLKVEKGEFVSIVGTSGSGKSTLLNIIGGLDKPTEGKVIIDNKNRLRIWIRATELERKMMGEE